MWFTKHVLLHVFVYAITPPTDVTSHGLMADSSAQGLAALKVKPSGICMPTID